MEPVNVGLLGLGTVGRGVAAILERNAAEIERRAGRPIRLRRAVVRDLTKARAAWPELELTTDINQVVAAHDIDIVCELIGGESIALDGIRTAIEHDKPVITANKALIALHGNEIFELARQKGVIVAFEAAVAGGIPIIKAIREGLVANRIDSIAGIINGTGNFILTEMAEHGRAFDEVLAEAQRLGYAEADPSFDVDGVDAAHKLTILASIAFGIPLQYDKVSVEGIRTIEPADVAYAAELGYRIKHLGVARRRADGFELRVHPALIPKRRLIANVNGVMNAVLVQGDAVGPTLYYGPGAGDEPTGAAVVADIIDVVRAETTDPTHRVPHLAFQFNALSSQHVFTASDFECGFYLRMHVHDKPGVLADITGIFGRLGISIEAVIQKEADNDDEDTDGQLAVVPLIMLTRVVKEGLIREAIEAVEQLGCLDVPIAAIRVENLGAN